MYTAKILSVEKEHLQESDNDQLAVVFLIADSEQSMTFREGFPLDTPDKEIQEAVQARLRLYKQEKIRAEKNKKSEEEQAQADETISKLEGKTFKLK
jgi:hypothetical protein